MWGGPTFFRPCPWRRTCLRSDPGDNMPHVIVKLWPGQSEQRKRKLADEITKAVMTTLKYDEESVSVGFEEIESKDWTAKGYKPDILGKADTIYKKPGYEPF